MVKFQIAGGSLIGTETILGNSITWTETGSKFRGNLEHLEI